MTIRTIGCCLLAGTVLLALQPTSATGEYPKCGNGVVEFGEECEPAGTGTCSEDCTITPCPVIPDCPTADPCPVCPEPDDCPTLAPCPDAPDCPDPEPCDACPPATDCPAPPDCPEPEACPPVPPPPPPPSCGDGIVQEGEDCEPPSAGTCDENCMLPPESECGDGIIQPGEDCEPPGVGSCNANCQIPPEPECGDGVIQDGEDCEPPGVGGCDENCQIPPEAICGDNIVQPPEECEPPSVGNCNENCQIVDTPPPPPPGPCGTCDDGDPRAVTLAWACDGPAPATVTVAEDIATYDPATGLLDITAGDDKLEKDIEISYSGGTDELHTSCSAELGPGVVTQGAGQDKKCQDTCSCSGCWRIVMLMSENGVEYCDVCPIPLM